MTVKRTVVGFLSIYLMLPGGLAQGDSPVGPGDRVAAAPTDPVLYYRFDPSGFEPPTMWLAPLLRMLNAAGVVRGEDQPVADGILIASLLGAHPHEAVVYELQAARYRPRELMMQRLQMVLAIDAPGRFGQLHQSLATIVSHYGPAATREQSVLKLPGGRFGIRYRQPTWPAWLTLEWSADKRQFFVGLGEGALERWFADEPGDDQRPRPNVHGGGPAVDAHRRLIDPPPGQAPFLETFVDLTRLRRGAPTLFVTGRTTPALELFELEDRHQWMVHGRRAGTFMVLEVTSERAGQFSRSTLSLDHWPEDAGMAMPPGKFHLVAPINWPAAAQRVLDLVRIIYDAPDRPMFDRLLDEYERQAGTSIDEYVEKLGPYVVACDYPRPWLTIPGTASVYAPLDPQADATEARAAFANLMAPLLPPIWDRLPQEVGVAFDRPRELYWLDSPMRQLFKAPAWGWADRTIVASFSPLAILQNRTFLNGGQDAMQTIVEQTPQP